jgi:hypothetical protein
VTACPHCGVELESPKRRSSAQNRLWWRYMTILGRELGYLPEEIHDSVKVKFLSREDLSTGLTIVQSTAKLSTERFSQLVEQLREWSHFTLGIRLPAPEERFEVAA